MHLESTSTQSVKDPISVEVSLLVVDVQLDPVVNRLHGITDPSIFFRSNRILYVC